MGRDKLSSCSSGSSSPKIARGGVLIPGVDCEEFLGEKVNVWFLFRVYVFSSVFKS